jgi:hypothetical protein
MQDTTKLTTYTPENSAVALVNDNGQITDLLAFKSRERGLKIRDNLQKPSLVKEIKHHGERKIMHVLYAIVKSNIKQFKTPRPMDDDDIITFCSDFIDVHRHEAIDDLLLMFKNARQGVYGTDYNRLDGPTLNAWFTQYLDQKAATREQIKHNEKMKTETVDAWSPYAKKMIKALRERLDNETKKRQNKPVNDKLSSYERYLEDLNTYAPAFSLKRLQALKIEIEKNNVNNVYGEALEIINKHIKIKSR